MEVPVLGQDIFQVKTAEKRPRRSSELGEKQSRDREEASSRINVQIRPRSASLSSLASVASTFPPLRSRRVSTFERRLRRLFLSSEQVPPQRSRSSTPELLRGHCARDILSESDSLLDLPDLEEQERVLQHLIQRQQELPSRTSASASGPVLTASASRLPSAASAVEFELDFGDRSPSEDLRLERSLFQSRLSPALIDESSRVGSSRVGSSRVGSKSRLSLSRSSSARSFSPSFSSCSRDSQNWLQLQDRPDTPLLRARTRRRHLPRSFMSDDADFTERVRGVHKTLVSYTPVPPQSLRTRTSSMGTAATSNSTTSSAKESATDSNADQSASTPMLPHAASRPASPLANEKEVHLAARMLLDMREDNLNARICGRSGRRNSKKRRKPKPTEKMDRLLLDELEEGYVAERRTKRRRQSTPESAAERTGKYGDSSLTAGTGGGGSAAAATQRRQLLLHPRQCALKLTDAELIEKAPVLRDTLIASSDLSKYMTQPVCVVSGKNRGAVGYIDRGSNGYIKVLLRSDMVTWVYSRLKDIRPLQLRSVLQELRSAQKKDAPASASSPSSPTSPSSTSVAVSSTPISSVPLTAAPTPIVHSANAVQQKASSSIQARVPVATANSMSLSAHVLRRLQPQLLVSPAAASYVHMQQQLQMLLHRQARQEQQKQLDILRAARAAAAARAHSTNSQENSPSTVNSTESLLSEDTATGNKTLSLKFTKKLKDTQAAAQAGTSTTVPEHLQARGANQNSTSQLCVEKRHKLLRKIFGCLDAPVDTNEAPQRQQPAASTTTTTTTTAAAAAAMSESERRLLQLLDSEAAARECLRLQQQRWQHRGRCSFSGCVKRHQVARRQHRAAAAAAALAAQQRLQRLQRLQRERQENEELERRADRFLAATRLQRAIVLRASLAQACSVEARCASPLFLRRRRRR
ncbi:MAG: hypothetical protein MHM6MM_000055 [Cercozoa sp. M6MM]